MSRIGYVICFAGGAVITLAMLSPSFLDDVSERRVTSVALDAPGEISPEEESVQEDPNGPRVHRTRSAPGQNPDAAQRGSRDHRPLPQTLSPDLVQEMLDVASDVDPDLAHRLRLEQQRDPEQFAIALRQMSARLWSWVELRRRDPQLYADKVQELHIDNQIRVFGRELREAIDAGRDDSAAIIEQQLRGVLQFQLAFAIKSRGDYINKLQGHVRKLQNELDDIASNMNAIIDERVADIRAGDDSKPPAWQRREQDGVVPAPRDVEEKPRRIPPE